MTIELARRAVLKGVFASFMATLPLSLVGCSDDAADPSPAGTAQGGAGAPGIYETYIPGEQHEAARIIAQRYLATVAPTASPDDIRALVAPTMELVTRNPDIAVGVAALRAQVTADFAAGQAQNVDGWTFARTELHVCVLASMPELAA